MEAVSTWDARLAHCYTHTPSASQVAAPDSRRWSAERGCLRCSLPVHFLYIVRFNRKRIQELPSPQQGFVHCRQARLLTHRIPMRPDTVDQAFDYGARLVTGQKKLICG